MTRQSIRFVFFGTPEPAVEILEALCAAGFAPAFVVTSPDRPKGRNLELAQTPVKEWAAAHGIPSAEPTNLTDPALHEQLRTLNADVFIVVAYGAILPGELLRIPRRGALNVHYSLLPKYRGASPVESQILTDDREVGVSILLLDEKMDHGPLVVQERVPIDDWPPTAIDLRRKSNAVAGKLLVGILPDWVVGRRQATPQDHSKATYTRKFTARDREIRLEDDAYKNFLKIQALSAWGTYFFADAAEKKIRVRIKSAEFKDGRFILKRVVPEGRKEMSYDDFLRGIRC